MRQLLLGWLQLRAQGTQRLTLLVDDEAKLWVDWARDHYALGLLPLAHTLNDWLRLACSRKVAWSSAYQAPRVWVAAGSARRLVWELAALDAINGLLPSVDPDARLRLLGWPGYLKHGQSDISEVAFMARSGRYRCRELARLVPMSETDFCHLVNGLISTGYARLEPWIEADIGAPISARPGSPLPEAQARASAYERAIVLIRRKFGLASK